MPRRSICEGGQPFPKHGKNRYAFGLRLGKPAIGRRLSRRSSEAPRFIDAARSEGGQLAALCSRISAKASIIFSNGDTDGEVAELAEGNRLLSGCTG